VTPDIITFAKGVTNGAVPMGGMIVRNEIHEAFMQSPAHAIELFHGNTYSGIRLPVLRTRVARSLSDENLFTRARKLETVFEEAVHSLKGAPRVIDIRNCGLAAGIDIEPDASAPGCAARTRCAAPISTRTWSSASRRHDRAGARAHRHESDITRMSTASAPCWRGFPSPRHASGFPRATK